MNGGKPSVVTLRPVAIAAMVLAGVAILALLIYSIVSLVRCRSGGQQRRRRA